MSELSKEIFIIQEIIVRGKTPTSHIAIARNWRIPLIHQIFIPFRCTNIDFGDDDLGIFYRRCWRMRAAWAWWNAWIQNKLSMTSHTSTANLFTFDVKNRRKIYGNWAMKRVDFKWTILVSQSLRLKIEAVPRLIQWFGLLSVFSWMNITKLDECPVVASTPRRSVVL